MLAESVLLCGIIIAISLTVSGDQDPFSYSNEEERQLIKTLFTNYSKNQRPSSTVNISLNLVVTNLEDVNPKREQIGLQIWFRMFWMDYRLQWNSSQCNITSLTVNFDEVWTPDMVLYSAVGDVRDFGVSSKDGLNMSVIIYEDGLIFFSQPTTIHSACAMNIADFPFDDQMCNMTFGSWTMDFTMVRLGLSKGGIDLSQFTKNNMWDLLYISAEAKNELYFWHDDPFSVVVYTIAVRRKALFYVVNYIAPPVAISLLSLLLFLIPPEVGKRMEAGINLLLCLSVYLLLVNSKMPSTSTAFPLLTKFYGCAIIILVLAMCCTCLVYALYFMNSSGLELHDASVALKFKNFILRWLKPLLFSCPCKCSKLKQRRKRPRVHPLETDFNLNEFETEQKAEKDKGKEERQSDEEQVATSSRDPPVIITTSIRDSLPRISATTSNDQEGQLTMAERCSVELSSSISSIASFKSQEDNLLTRVYSLPAEDVGNPNMNEKHKKVTFSFQENGGVKRRPTFRKCSESAVKQTERTLFSTAGSSWFSQSSWDAESQENGNEENGKQFDDVSRGLTEEMNQSTELDCEASEKDSDADDQASNLFDQLVLSVDTESSKSSNTQQWQKAAMVLDRMFIIVLFTSIVVSFLSCLLLAPRVREYFTS